MLVEVYDDDRKLLGSSTLVSEVRTPTTDFIDFQGKVYFSTPPEPTNGFLKFISAYPLNRKTLEYPIRLRP